MSPSCLQYLQYIWSCNLRHEFLGAWTVCCYFWGHKHIRWHCKLTKTVKVKVGKAFFFFKYLVLWFGFSFSFSMFFKNIMKVTEWWLSWWDADYGEGFRDILLQIGLGQHWWWEKQNSFWSVKTAGKSECGYKALEPLCYVKHLNCCIWIYKEWSLLETHKLNFCLALNNF